MPKSPNQKQRILLLARIFLEETDENHPLSMRQLLARLDAADILADRRTLYDDFACLTLMGMEIQQAGKGKYFTESRLFETAELKLLTDAVASARFLSEKKSQQLIGKLTTLASYSSRKELNRQLHVAGKAKTVNEQVNYSVDALHRAIRENRQVSFRYFDWSVRKERVYRRNGELYVVSPWALLWEDERYYLLAYSSRTNSIRHYRVDKTESLTVTSLPREGADVFAEVRPETYASRVFGMFGGTEQTVTLRAEEELAGVFIDRFGSEIVFLNDGDHFRVSLRVVPSGNFFGWVFSFGGRVRIISPASVQEEFDRCLRALEGNV